jgi:hydroxypyruvate reductase
VIPRAVCEQAFRTAVVACDPERLVRQAMARIPPQRAMLGVAVGKAALAMARGAGPVVHGICVAPQLDGKPLPLGWTARDGGHPFVDERSLAAGEAVRDLVYSAGFDDLILVLISGGASALIEVLAGDYTLAEYRARVEQAMRSGVAIGELNELRGSMSAIKAGRLATYSKAPIITLAVSDVVGDDLRVIGSGPTIGYPGDPNRSEVIAPIRSFAEATHAALAGAGIQLALDPDPLWGDVATLAPHVERGVHWGEPTVRVPDEHGDGGRMQQLALLLAERLRGTDRSAFCAGSDGIDGPPPTGRPAPAGAYIDGSTWEAIEAAGIDPSVALARRDAGTALAAVGALVITGPTGINHADVCIVG